MSNLIINCPHCNRSTPVELGKRVTTRQRCRHCGLVVGESDIVVGGRKPIVRKRVTMGANRYGAEEIVGDESPAWEQGKRRRYRPSFPVVLMILLAPVLALGGVAWLLKKGYFSELEEHEVFLKQQDQLRESEEQQAGKDFHTPKKRRSTAAGVDTELKCYNLIKEIQKCASPEELLRYVRKPDEVGDELRAYYAEGRGALPIGDELVAASDLLVSYDDEDRIVIFHARNRGGDPWFVVFQEGIGLKLMKIEPDGDDPNADYTTQLPALAYNLVVVALVDSELHFRIFNAAGEIVVDQRGRRQAGGDKLAALKKRLSPFPAEGSLSADQDWEIIQAVSSITGYSVEEADRVPKLDWKSFVLYSGQDVFKFLEEKTRKPTEFRVLGMIDDYFNYRFSEPKDWICVQIFDPGESFMFYGYAERQSLLGSRVMEQIPPKVITISEGVTNTAGGTATRVNGLNEVWSGSPGFRKPNIQVTLKLAFPEEPQGDNQVEIVEIVRESWYVP